MFFQWLSVYYRKILLNLEKSKPKFLTDSLKIFARLLTHEIGNMRFKLKISSKLSKTKSSSKLLTSLGYY